MKEFFVQYLFNLWVYGSQAIVLLGAGRVLWAKYETAQMAKRIGVLQGRPVLDPDRRSTSDFRNERAG